MCLAEGWPDGDASVLNGSTEQIKNFHFASHFEVHQTVSLLSESMNILTVPLQLVVKI